MQTQPSNSSPAANPSAAIIAVALVLAIGVGVWFLGSKTTVLRIEAREQAEKLLTTNGVSSANPRAALVDSRPAAGDQAVSNLLQFLDAWTTKLTFATAATGSGMLVTLLLGVAWWRRAWISHMRRQHQEWEEQSQRYRETVQEMRRHKTARERLEREMGALQSEFENRVQERTEELRNSYVTLERELNNRRQAAMTLTHQRQELVRSKDVLELSVQARAQELQTLQRRYEYILNSAGDGIYGLDLQGKTTFVNPAAAKLTGWKVEELVGRAEDEIFCRKTANADPTSNTQLVRQGSAQGSDQIFQRKDGSTFPVEYVRTPILENNKAVGAVVIFKDITERKRAEEVLSRKAAELARSNAELEQFAYVASHDLQEPLRKILAFGDRLKAKVDAVKLEEGRDYLERMQGAAARMQQLISDLLTFSRVISSSQPFVPVDLNVVTLEVLNDLEVGIERSNAQIMVDPLPTIEADPLQMRQLLQNLVSNSLKFQPPNASPIIKIQAQILSRPFSCVKNPTPDDEVCELTVEDNGIGFDEKYLDKVFAVFQRLHGRSEYEGTGVGLAVCRRITDRHGGTITAKSKPGEGATFIVTLPVRQPNGNNPA